MKKYHFNELSLEAKDTASLAVLDHECVFACELSDIYLDLYCRLNQNARQALDCDSINLFTSKDYKSLFDVWHAQTNDYVVISFDDSIFNDDVVTKIILSDLNHAINYTVKRHFKEKDGLFRCHYDINNDTIMEIMHAIKNHDVAFYLSYYGLNFSYCDNTRTLNIEMYYKDTDIDNDKLYYYLNELCYTLDNFECSIADINYRLDSLYNEPFDHDYAEDYAENLGLLFDKEGNEISDDD